MSDFRVHVRDSGFYGKTYQNNLTKQKTQQQWIIFKNFTLEQGPENEIILSDLNGEGQTLRPLAVAVDHPVGLVIHGVGRHGPRVLLSKPGGSFHFKKRPTEALTYK